jgi:energy-coupling factor transport system permease protein
MIAVVVAQAELKEAIWVVGINYQSRKQIIMMRNISLGQFQPGDTWLYRLDTRAKLIPAILISVASLFTESMLFEVTMVAGMLILLLTAGIDRRLVGSTLKPALFLVLFTAAYHIVFSSGQTQILFEVFGFGVTEGAIWMACFYSLRFILLVAVLALVTLTSSPSDIAEAVTSPLRIFETIRVPVYDATLVLFMALRFVPILYDEITAIRYAQIVRGMSFAGSFIHRIRASTALVLPVFLATIRRADDLALAIEARGHGTVSRRTYYLRSAFGVKEWLFSLVWIAVVAVVYYFTLPYE